MFGEKGPSVKNHRKSRSLASAIAVLAALTVLTGASGLGATTSHAEGNCVLSPEPVEIIQLHSTRATIKFQGNSTAGTVKATFEYATSPNGPWSVVGERVQEAEAEEGNLGVFAFNMPIVHLTPVTQYFGRVLVDNGCSETVKPFEFKTMPVEAPEVDELEIRQVEAEKALGREYADYEAVIEGNGAATTYQFEVRKSGEASWSIPSGTGIGGTVTVAEDFTVAKAHITGLTESTPYELRVTAANQAGSGQATTSFTTPSSFPKVTQPGFGSVGAETVQVKDTVVPRSSETTWRFEYATSEDALKKCPEGIAKEQSKCQAEGVRVGPEGTIGAFEADEGAHPVEGELTGLVQETRYYVRLHAENGHEPAATSSPRAVETAGAPLALTLQTHAFAPGEGTIRVLGSVKPHGYDTHFHFEYVSEDAFKEGGWAKASDTPEADAGTGASEGGQGFPIEIRGANLLALREGETYRYRLVASNAKGSSTGVEQSLKVPVAAISSTPACANAAVRVGASAALPDCRAYELVTPAEKEGSMDNWAYSRGVSTPVAVGEDGEHVMVRAQFSRWGTNIGAANNAYFFTRNPGAGWRMTSATPQPQAKQNNYQPGLFNPTLTQLGAAVSWSSTTEKASSNIELVAGTPGGPYAPVVSGVRSSQPEWVGASRDFHTLILSKSGKLYEWRGAGEPVLIDACPATIAQARNGGVPGGAVSDDGTRVFFEAGCSGSPHLYMRVDHKENQDLGPYRFIASNRARTQILVEGKSAGETYEYSLYDTESKQLKPLFTVREQHIAMNASADLSEVYLSSREVLTPDTPPVSSTSEYMSKDTEPLEVYRYDVAEGKLHFILQADSGGIGGRSSTYVSPDGRYLYFTTTALAGVFSEREHLFLTKGGFFSIEEQVYRYDSTENVVECMSCASGFDPRPQLIGEFLPESVEEGVDGVPSLVFASENGDYAFFATPARLLPQDVDGELYAGTFEGVGSQVLTGEHDFYYSHSSDVYEWRRNGVGGCGQVQGCLALISSGAGGLKNILLGADASGRDVFFATHSALVGQDRDSQGDVYDARMGGGFQPPAPPAAQCAGDACVTPFSGPIDTTPASLSFSGSPNPTGETMVKPAKTKRTPCKRSARHRGKRCARHSRKHRTAKPHRKTVHARVGRGSGAGR